MVEINAALVGENLGWSVEDAVTLSNTNTTHVVCTDAKMVIIETSHIAFHSWDESLPAVIQLDIYSCKDFEPEHIFKELEVFKIEKLEYKFLDRENNFKNIERNVNEY